MCCPLCRYQEYGRQTVNAKRKPDTNRTQDAGIIDLKANVASNKDKGKKSASGEVTTFKSTLYNHCNLSSAQLGDIFKKKNDVVTCHLCSKSFINGQQLNAHIQKWCSQVVCTKCKVKFSSKEALGSHHEVCAIFACQHCPKRFVSYDTLNTHQTSKHSTAQCDYCSSAFTSDAEREKHLNDYHNFDCQVCQKAFLYTIDKMKVKYYNNNNKVVCDFCEADTASGKEFQHPVSSIKEEPKESSILNITQEILGKKRKRSTDDPEVAELETQDAAYYAVLPENGPLDEGDDNMQYQCCYCRGIYNSFNELNTHLIDSHNLQLQELSTDSQTEKENFADAFEKHESKIDELFDTAVSLIDFENDTQYTCKVCDKVFKSSATYRKHIYRVHKLHLIMGVEKLFHCQHCKIERNTLCELNKHLYNRHESDIKCEHCDEIFCTKRDKKIHILGQHPDQPAFSCLDCTLKFNSHNELKQHCSWHWFHEIIECKDCNKKIKGKKKFKIHMNYHKARLSQSERDIICPECGKSLSSRSSLHAHMRYMHRGGNEETVLCGDCGILVKVRRFNRHQERMHSQGNLFRCHICSRAFFAKELLRQHMDTHIIGRPHECDQCPAAFKQLRNLRMHKRNYHSDSNTTCKICNVHFDNVDAYSDHRLSYHKRTPKPIKLEAEEGFQCPQCPKTLKSSRAVATHRRIAHEKHLHVKCDLCHLEFPFIRQLQNHMTTHTEPKPDLSCGFCHRTFTTLGSLNSHIKWVHVGERNFPCSYCPAKFKRKDAQIVHERTHTDERPYSCGVCQRRFRQRTDCKRHEAKHSMPGFRYNKPHRMRPRPMPEVLIEEVVEQAPGEDTQAAAFLSFIVQN